MDDDKKFLEAKNFGMKGYCHMKLRNPLGGWPINYGIVYRHDLTTIYLIEAQTGRITKETVTFTSIDEMLNAGWMVD